VSKPVKDVAKQVLNAYETKGVVVITASGRMFSESDKKGLLELIFNYLDQNKGAFVIDFRKAWINSTILSGLVVAYKKIKEANGSLALVIPTPMTFSEPIKLFELFYTVDEAVAALGESCGPKPEAGCA